MRVERKLRKLLDQLEQMLTQLCSPRSVATQNSSKDGTLEAGCADEEMGDWSQQRARVAFRRESAEPLRSEPEPRTCSRSTPATKTENDYPVFMTG